VETTTGAGRGGGACSVPVAMTRPTLSVHLSRPTSASAVKTNAPPSVWLPPRAFHARSACGQKRASSAARLASAASIPCLSDAARPIAASPSWSANTCGRSIEVSVMPISR
jgi:hypothetical protein